MSKKFTRGLICAICAAISTGFADGAISYGTAGAVYSANFDALPTDPPSNANIQTAAYTSGWRDDTTTVPGTHVSVPGWYLYHPITQTEGGFSGNQRLRFGSGSSNTGSFYGFATGGPTDTEKALGSVGSTTLAANGSNLYTALRLVNDSGSALSSFTVTYDGEQWRRGNSVTGETLVFDYSLTATAADWFSTATFSPVPGLNFTSPFLGAEGAVAGNSTGRVGDITATVTGISWAPGSELWLRWADQQIAGNDDGVAIDNVRFTAVPEPAGVAFLIAGAVAWAARRRRK